MIEARKKITEALISTRDGETNSIVKIVQAESANMNTETVSQQDRIEVMLKGITNDINEIRNSADRTSYVKNYETNVYPEKLFYENNDSYNMMKSKLLWNNNSINVFLVKLKKDITLDEINDALNRIKNRGIKIRHTQNGNQLAVEVVDEKNRGFEQIDLFSNVDEEELKKENDLQKVTLKIKNKYGKNSILKGTDFEKGAKAKERNEQIGGHKA